MGDAGCGGERKLKKERCALLVRAYPGLCFLPSFSTGASPLDPEVGGGEGRSRRPAGFPAQFRDPILFSRAETSALLLTNGEQRPRAACGKGKLLAPLDLGGSRLLLNVSSCHLFTFFCLLSPIFFPSS